MAKFLALIKVYLHEQKQKLLFHYNVIAANGYISELNFHRFLIKVHVSSTKMHISWQGVIASKHNYSYEQDLHVCISWWKVHCQLFIWAHSISEKCKQNAAYLDTKKEFCLTKLRRWMHVQEVMCVY